MTLPTGITRRKNCNTRVGTPGQNITLRVPIHADVVPPAMVWGINDILKWVQTIEAELGTPYNLDNMDTVAERMASLCVHYSSSVNAYASAQWYLAAARANSYEVVWQRVKNQDQQVLREMSGVASSTNVKNYVRDRCADLIWLEAQTERLNSAITHSIDALRSILSKGKVEMQVSSYAQNMR